MWVVAGSTSVGVVFALGAVLLLAGRKFAAWSALLGCAAQAALIAGAWMMAGYAGPI